MIADRCTINANGCWIPSTKACTPDGYRIVTDDGEVGYAHRLAYRQYVGEIPEAHDIDHTCRNRACCNPLHLEAVTRAENLRRAHAARYGHDAGAECCVNGHPWIGNERWTTGRLGRPARYCAKCKSISRRLRRLGGMTDRRRNWHPITGGAA